MTLTTNEELKHLASSDNANELTRRLARECLGNREAQPVAWRHDDGPFAGIAITRSKSVADNWMAKGRAVTPLYTAPPAPAVPGELLDAMEEVIRISDRDHEAWDKAKAAITACRAAMLAQPVSSGYKLPPHVYRDLVNSLRDTAVQFSGTEQLRERLNTTLHQFIEPDHPHTRTVAPEGGNDA